MRALVIVEPGPIGPPPDMLLGVIEAFKGWRDRWRPKMEAFEFFPEGGGWGVLNCSDVEVSQAMMEFPFAPFSKITVRITVDGDDALTRMAATMQQMLSGA